MQNKMLYDIKKRDIGESDLDILGSPRTSPTAIRISRDMLKVTGFLDHHQKSPKSPRKFKVSYVDSIEEDAGITNN